MRNVKGLLLTVLLAAMALSNTVFAWDFEVYDASDVVDIAPERLEELKKEYGIADTEKKEATVTIPNKAGGNTETPATAAKAAPTASTVIVNGKTVNFDAYNINGYNYFKLRDIATAVNNTEKNFHVGFNSYANIISLSARNAYVPVGGELAAGDGKEKTATPTTSRIEVDMEYITPTAYNIGGYNYFKLRDICKEFDIGVGFDGATNTITINTGEGYTE